MIRVIVGRSLYYPKTPDGKLKKAVWREKYIDMTPMEYRLYSYKQLLGQLTKAPLKMKEE